MTVPGAARRSRISRRDLRAEIDDWAIRLNVAPRRVQIQPMMKKWASCSTAGRLTFSSDLLGEPSAFRAEVIVHELLHLTVPNHGRLFKALLRTYLGSAVGRFSCSTTAGV